MRFGIGLGLSDMRLVTPGGMPPATGFAFTQEIADTLGFTVQERTADYLRITGSTGRNHISWMVNFPAGTRIRFTWETPGSFVCRVTNEPLLNAATNSTVVNAAAGVGAGTVDYTLVAARQYFGFLNTNPTATVIVRDLMVNIA